jgi:hypothetical protein
MTNFQSMTDSAQPLADVADHARVSETPLVDKGFASVRKIGNGLYGDHFRHVEGKHDRV